MATLTAQVGAIGKASKRDVRALAARTLLLGVYNFDFDNSYPTGGEDISAIWTDFPKGVLSIHATQVPNRLVTVDLTGKKVLLQTAFGTEAANASDQSTITGVRLTVVGLA